MKPIVQRVPYALPNCPHCGGTLTDPDRDHNRTCLDCRYTVMAAIYTIVWSSSD